LPFLGQVKNSFRANSPFAAICTRVFCAGSTAAGIFFISVAALWRRKADSRIVFFRFFIAGKADLMYNNFAKYQ